MPAHSKKFLKKILPYFSADLSALDKKNLHKFAETLMVYLTTKDLSFLDPKIFGPRVERYWQLCRRHHQQDAIVDIDNSDRPLPHGGKTKRYRTAFFIAVPNINFIISTMLNALRSQGLELHVMLHSVMSPDKVNIARAEGLSCLYVESGRISDPAQLDAIEEFLRMQIHDNLLVTGAHLLSKEKFDTICQEYQALPDAETQALQESIAFLQWLKSGKYIVFGMRNASYRGKAHQLSYHVDDHSAAGLFKNPDIEISAYRKSGEIMPEEYQHFAASKNHIKVVKSTYSAIVHRLAPYDVVIVKRFDPKGSLIGEYEFFGLFASSYYATAVTDIPILRMNAERIMTLLSIAESQYSTGLFYHVLNNYPRDDLWQEDVAALAEDVMAVIEAESCEYSRLLIHTDPYENFISANLYVPSDRYSLSLTEKVIAALEQDLNATLRERYFYIGDGTLARVNMIFHTMPGEVPKFSKEALEKKIIALSRPWSDELHESLMQHYDEETAQNLYMCYMHAFPINYRDITPVSRTVADIDLIEKAYIDSDKMAVTVYECADNGQWNFRIAQSERHILLSEILPKLESMGVKVLAEDHYHLSPLGSPQVSIHDFALDVGGADKKILQSSFMDTFREIWSGRFAADSFNALTLKTGLNHREILLFRTMSAYFRQGKLPFLANRICECLIDYPVIARHLVDYFHARFNPKRHADKLEKQIRTKIMNALRDVKTLDEDRILRVQMDLIAAMQRTNFYQDIRNGNDPILSFKIADQELDFLPEPRPFREIFVYCERFEAVHLRFGLVARGGLRWSDRQDDFRTEILGLVKAQQVKNAVIVPVGSKGGFVLKTAQSSREDFLKEGIACYKRFIQSMLDITDNLKGNDIVPPPNVVRQDGDDPYLVVAADKGTATFSDIANEIAVNHGFWLGDAFASGGSAGYDHKKMGITARGAWECVKRHFREMSIDIQTTPFDVVGIGDMSGDVFGNGMLLSKQIRLRAAFNHMHIVIDPDPDPESSWKERKRLFDMPRSSWQDYNPKLLSKGGQIYERAAKELKLSPEAQAMLGGCKASMTPNDLINKILKSRTDLLWFGGIGTYIKASHESHADAGDKTNDDIRVNADEVQTRVIGEGANLGITHRARIEYAIHGGHCNTDAVDNSAGVDCSDHEVNLKILLTHAINAKSLKTEDRNPLLEDMTDDIAALVLRNNYQQSQTLSFVLQHAPDFIDEHQQMVRDFVAQDLLNRRLEFLPLDDEIESRRERHLGFNRPELCVLLAYAKNIAYQEILHSELPDEPYFRNILYHYFPDRLAEMFGKTIETHRLKREIIATVLTNQIINCTGPSFINQLKLTTGADITDIVRAFFIVHHIFDLGGLRSQIETLDNQIDTSLQLNMIFETYRTFDRIVEWFILHEKSSFPLPSCIDKYGRAVKALRDNIDKILFGELAQAYQARIAKFAHDNIPEQLAVDIASLKIVSSACEISQLAEGLHQDVKTVANYYFALSERFSIDWLRSQINLLSNNANRWERKALAAVGDELWHFQSALTRFVIRRYGEGHPTNQSIKMFLDDHHKTLGIIDALLMDCRKQTLSLALLTVAVRELKNLLLH